MKRVTGIFLAIAMLLALAPMNIFAADAEKTTFSDMKDTDYYAQAATALEQLDILAGYPDGTFGAEKSITRAEMAAIVCRMIDKEADAEKAKGETKFDDVDAEHWASGYINLAAESGIITGDGNGKFRPEDDVKYEEAIKMVVCALGYGSDIKVDPEDWSKGYLEVAAEKGISNDLKGTKGSAATRGDVAVMSYNGLAADTENSKIPAAPTASLKAGEYKGTQKVKLTTTTKDADIYYTTDSTAPTVKSTKYTKEISITATCTLKAVAVKNGVVSKSVMSVDYTITKKTSSGGGGGGSVTTPISSAELQVNETAVSTANVGDTLTLVTTPAGATGTITWTVGGTKIEATGNTYTVTAFDMGKTIKAEIKGTGFYNSTASAECTVENKTQVNAQDIMSSDADSSPIVLTDAENTTFLDNEGNPVSVDADSTLTLSIDKPEKGSEEVAAATTLAIQKFIENSSAGVAAEDLTDVTAIAVDVNLSLNESAVHPVGDVTVTLSAEQLGLPAGTDLSTYTFSANHTNKNNENEVVNGTIVTINDVQYVRFELNGLSTIWIGNIPPRTVSFYNTEEDADNKVNSIGSVVVKFGDLTPTKQIPTPSRSGYLFCGWNYDMTRTPIITNLEVHALWIEGVKMPVDSFSTIFSEDTSALSVETGDGLVSIDCEEPESVPANLAIKVSVSAPADAVKYYVGTDAAVVAAFDNADEYLDAADEINFEINVTDENGIIVPSSNTYYYKWIDEAGAVISLQEIKVRIANGSDTATSMEYTANVNRGIGKFEAYLIDNDDSSKTYVGYINNHLSGAAKEGYTLYTNVSFDGYRNNYEFSSYDKLQFVFTPFEGEAYKTTDSISAAGEYYNGNDWNENWTGSCEIKDGNLIVTYPFNTRNMSDDYAYATVTVNGNKQEIDINWDNGGYSDESETIDCETWDDVLAALRGVSQSKLYYIPCKESSPITLTSSLTIPANVDISLNSTPSFTVANGATLTMADDRNHSCSSSLRISKGDLIVANGGTITSSYVGTTDGNRYYPYVNARNITFSSGSTLKLPTDTLLSIHSYHRYDDSEKGVLSFENGSTVDNAGNIHTNDFDVVNLNGTFTSTRYTYIYGDEINVNGKINVVPTQYGRFELYGTVNIGESGSITVEDNLNRNNTNLEIYGPLNNNGIIDIKGNKTNAIIMNNGFVNYNNGTISVASGCSISTSGTKFINTGIITGDGVLDATLGDDYTNYDDGTDYVEVEDDEYWDEGLEKHVYKLSDYSRYKFTHDPAKTVDTILYLAEVINMGEGQCTLKINSEDFPQN